MEALEETLNVTSRDKKCFANSSSTPTSTKLCVV